LQNAQIAAQALSSVSQGVNNGTITKYFYRGLVHSSRRRGRASCSSPGPVGS
jgi:hypothetical protein